MRIAILISGGGSNMAALVDAMQSGAIKANPVLVLCNNSNASGIDRAAERGIRTVVVDHRPHGEDRAAFDAELQRALLAHKVDAVCLAGFMRVLTTPFVEFWAGRMLNIHPSLLPKYRGLHTHQRAIEAGDTEAGCTVHLVTPQLDVGPILGQRRVPIHANDTAEPLARRVLAEEHILYPKALSQFVLQHGR